MGRAAIARKLTFSTAGRLHASELHNCDVPEALPASFRKLVRSYLVTVAAKIATVIICIVTSILTASVTPLEPRLLGLLYLLVWNRFLQLDAVRTWHCSPTAKSWPCNNAGASRRFCFRFTWLTLPLLTMALDAEGLARDLGLF